MPKGCCPFTYPGTNAIGPGVPDRQCAAVTARSPCGLCTTVAVQKCVPSCPEFSLNSAPTAATPANACPLCGAPAVSCPAACWLGPMSSAAPPAAGTSSKAASPAAAASTANRRSGFRPPADHLIHQPPRQPGPASMHRQAAHALRDGPPMLNCYLRPDLTLEADPQNFPGIHRSSAYEGRAPSRREPGAWR